VPPGRVPATFLLAEVDGAIVGRVSIRHELNDYLERFGGHIGYAVRPAHRRRGYGRAILRQSLDVARSVGLSRVLLTCDDTNAASVRIIESCGGLLEDVVAADEGTPASLLDPLSYRVAAKWARRADRARRSGSPTGIMGGMGDRQAMQGTTRRRVPRYVAGLSLIVLTFAVGMIRAEQSGYEWWAGLVSMTLIFLGLELSVAPELRAWSQRNRARIAERDAALRAGFEGPDQ